MKAPPPSSSNAPPPRDAPPPYETVVFDCDSTLSAMEGIEELAGGRASPARARELAALTQGAMDGELPLEAVYGRRLELVAPTRADMQRIGALYVERALPHARALCDALHALGKRVWVVSGGLLEPVLHLARELGIEAARVRAVDVVWDADGGYRDFERSSPLARSGGKAVVLGEIAARPDGGRIVLVGDGATDLEAAHLCARFVAFGGVERREAVFARSLVHCEEADLAALAPLLLSPAELAALERSGRHAPLLERLADRDPLPRD